MDDSRKEKSVYALITELCEKFSKNTKHVKHLRSLSYEILLRKQSNFEHEINESKSSIYDLLAWQFTLSNHFGLVENSQEIGEYGEFVRKSFGDSVLKFLLCLKQLPESRDESMEIDLSEDFKQLFNIPSNIVSKTATSIFSENLVSASPSIWDIAASEPFNDRKTWEDYGHPEPDKEKCFVSELGRDCNNLIASLPSVLLSVSELNRNNQHTFIKLKIISIPEFVKNLKHLLVGMESECFRLKNGEFYLVSNLTVTGIAPTTLAAYCDNMILSGRCYKSLNEISTYSSKSEQHGYIFAEFCQSIQRYLQMYRTVILHFPETVGLLKIENTTKEIRSHIKTLAEICRLPPFYKNKHLPHGVLLLNYLYKTVLSVFDKKLLLVLYAMLFPCCQVYFNRFLQQWLLDGVVNDPFDEFFIKPNFKYISSRGRTYWTRGYFIREEIVPDFLFDFKADILNCGKAMNLLKLSVKTSKLCLYLMGKKPLIISCCVTREQLSLLEQNVTSYYLEILSECGPIVNLEQVVKRNKEQDAIFMNLIAKKRAVSLHRRELERKRKYAEERERKMEEFAALREQYDAVLKQKQERIAEEIEEEMKLIEFNLRIEQTRDNLIERESKILIDYYNELFEISDKRKKKIEKRIEVLKKTHLEVELPLEPTSSNESFYSIEETAEKQEIVVENSKKVEEEEIKQIKQIHSSKSLDIINANETVVDKHKHFASLDAFNQAKANRAKVLNQEMDINFSETKKIPSELVRNDMETFRLAREIKAKVLSEEMGIFDPLPIKPKKQLIDNNVENMTDLQRNRLRVMNSEFGFGITIPELKKKAAVQSQCEINRNLVMKSSDCFYSQVLDNAHVQKENRNVVVIEEKEEEPKKSSKLSLDIVKTDRPLPMSVDSTPMSDITTFSRLQSVKSDMGSLPTTSETQITQEEFDFEADKNSSYIIPANRSDSSNQREVFSKRLTAKDVKGIMPFRLKFFIRDSVELPLSTQQKLVHNELLSHFVNDLHYFHHLESLRSYFFLQDGEFSRNITEKLFEELYSVRQLDALVNVRNLHTLIFGAVEMSSKIGVLNSSSLSFKIKSVPMSFDITDPEVLGCISLTYKVNWPLNILLTRDTLAKYDEIFKYLLNVSRVSWVLKRVCMDLKSLAKKAGKKEIYLMASPHYRKLHQGRHVMLHFVQTFQNYIVGEVLQTSWEIFEQNLSSVTSIEALYSAHTVYIKHILFLCLLNQKAAPLQKVIQKIFRIIFRFYEYLRGKSWKCVDGEYVHANFGRMKDVFTNFERLVLYLFKAGRKVAKSGYQPHLTQLLDMLDVNGYYSNKLQNVAGSTH